MRLLAGPARRTSHKLLERIIEFVEHVGFKNFIVERNMENMRVRTLSDPSKTSLVRSFPSNVGVRRKYRTRYRTRGKRGGKRGGDVTPRKEVKRFPLIKVCARFKNRTDGCKQ